MRVRNFHAHCVDSTHPLLREVCRFADGSLPAFVAVLRGWSDNPAVRPQAINSLERASRVNPGFLIQCIQHDHAIIRYHALRMLERTGSDSPDIVPLLVKALSDDDLSVRRAATDVLIQFDRPKARELGLDPTPEKRRRY